MSATPYPTAPNWPKDVPLAHFQGYVERRTAVLENGCWEWIGSISTSGYALNHIRALNEPHTHRLSYRAFVGALPPGLVIDHLCRNRSCVNPDHLEAVSHRENILRGISGSAINARKTHCKHGHELGGTNLVNSKHIHVRRCAECNRAKERRRCLRQKGGI